MVVGFELLSSERSVGVVFKRSVFFMRSHLWIHFFLEKKIGVFFRIIYGWVFLWVKQAFSMRFFSMEYELLIHVARQNL